MSSPPADPRDVRMRGFPFRVTVEEAQRWVDDQAAPMGSESVPLDEAFGRVLSADVVATVDVPGFARSAMDGYAVQSGDTVGAGDYSPILLELVGESYPGRPCGSAVGPGQAVRIMTGAPLPQGADAVVPAETAREAPGGVEIVSPVPSRKHVGQVGEDVRAGQVILPSGRRLRPQDLGLAAAVGQAALTTRVRPHVRILVTGEELAEPGGPRGAWQTYEANSFILRALVQRDGGLVESIVRLPDDRTQIRAALLAPGADVLLVSGGSSVGAEDHAPGLIRELGELPIHGVAMRPSSPAGMGRIGGVMAFLLPGNPVSCLCAYDFFAGRAIRGLGGRAREWPYRRKSGVLARKIASAIGRVDYCRVRATEAGVEPLALSGASILSSTTRADGFVVIPALCEGYDAGVSVDVWRYQD
ncbi:MAG: molybdopterin molybdotransferase MoeA [Planctomyces sp.]|nr:molybdopterin molybdotransferase MoeA [Planctomyces sp.]